MPQHLFDSRQCSKEARGHFQTQLQSESGIGCRVLAAESLTCEEMSVPQITFGVVHQFRAMGVLSEGARFHERGSDNHRSLEDC